MRQRPRRAVEAPDDDQPGRQQRTAADGEQAVGPHQERQAEQEAGHAAAVGRSAPAPRPPTARCRRPAARARAPPSSGTARTSGTPRSSEQHGGRERGGVAVLAAPAGGPRAPSAAAPGRRSRAAPRRPRRRRVAGGRAQRGPGVEAEPDDLARLVAEVLARVAPAAAEVGRTPAGRCPATAPRPRPRRAPGSARPRSRTCRRRGLRATTRSRAARGRSSAARPRERQSVRVNRGDASAPAGLQPSRSRSAPADRGHRPRRVQAQVGQRHRRRRQRAEPVTSRAACSLERAQPGRQATAEERVAHQPDGRDRAGRTQYVSTSGAPPVRGDGGELALEHAVGRHHADPLAGVDLAPHDRQRHAPARSSATRRPT